MVRIKILIWVLVAAFILGGCTSTQYITDKDSIKRQQKMKMHRVGVGAGTVCLNLLNIFVAAILNSEYVPVESEQTYKNFRIGNLANDSLVVNMVTDIILNDSIYCDVLGIVLPPGKHQRLLLPYPAAYNIYFKVRGTEEEKVEIRTDDNLRRLNLKPGMTHLTP